MEDGENLATGGEMLPLRIRPCHVGNQRAVTPCLGMEKHRKMGCERSGAVVGDE